MFAKMYQASRLALIVGSLAAWIAFGEFVVLAWPTSLYLVAAVGACLRLHRRRRRNTTLGSARFASRRDLQAAGMVNADRGLILGRLAIDGGDD